MKPYSIDDLLKAHGIMMTALIDFAGRFRTSGVAVVAGTELIHLALLAERVPGLMSDLFGWLKQAEDHLLVRSCVFHYEFEFIHPFADGKGRVGRFWQSLLLGQLHPVFQHLPVETMVYANQQEYYQAINLRVRSKINW
ncbi:MAG: Fic family protein [Victivallaceae bacterium]|nr:Fic family protein [Victivallaceae bacterium]